MDPWVLWLIAAVVLAIGEIATMGFFLAPFAGICVGLYMWLTRNRHELPYGPYLSLATGVVLLVYCPIAEYLRPGFEGLGAVIRNSLGG